MILNIKVDVVKLLTVVEELGMIALGCGTAGLMIKAAIEWLCF